MLRADALLRAAAERLRERAGSDARLEAELLLAHALGVARTALLGDVAFDEAARARFESLLNARVHDARPVAQLLGVRGFWDLELRVDERVLVPRPETELLLEVCFELDAAGALPDGPFADRGTGSGALALAAAARRAVIAVERSGEACEVARANLAELAAGRGLLSASPGAARARASRVLLVHGSGLGMLRAGSVAAVLANPPYVRATEYAQLRREVREHEPRVALVPDDEDVAAEFRRVGAEARHALTRHGVLLMEVGAGDAPLALDSLRDAGLEALGTHRDLAGHERVVRARQR
ncbi:MAG: release factor glutamine methyltransferase [Planctomycetota bacterium]|nr:MAG: release factor glutamine methyltransferase [Planctomycetota bacterium]